MIDLVENAAEACKALGYEDTFVRRLDSMTGMEGIVIRRLPSTVVGQYRDLTKTIGYLWQVVVRRRSERAAIEQADELCAYFDQNPVASGNGSYRIVAQEVYTLPQELALDESGFFAQEFRIRSTIEIERS